MLLSLAVAVLAAAPASGSVQLATGSFRFVAVSKELQDFLPEHLAQAMSSEAVHVVTPREIGEVLGLERQKQLMGCTDDSNSCLAELSGALGVDGLILGDIANVGGLIQVNLKVIDPARAKQLAAWSTRVGSERELLSALERGGAGLAIDTRIALGRARPSSLRAKAWIPIVAGAVALAGGGTLLMFAKDRHDRLTTQPAEGPIPNDRATALSSEGATFQTVGFVAIGVGAAAALAGGALYVFGSPVEPVGVVSPQGAAVGLRGAF